MKPRRTSSLRRASEDAHFLEAFGRILSFVSTDIAFSCDGCLDAGYSFSPVEVDGRVYEIAHHCSSLLTTRDGRKTNCTAANDTILEILLDPDDGGGGGRVGTGRAGPNAYQGGNDEPDSRSKPQKLILTYRKLLPGATEAERIMKNVLREFGRKNEVRERRMAPNVERAKKVIDAIRSKDSRGQQLPSIRALVLELEEIDRDDGSEPPAF